MKLFVIWIVIAAVIAADLAVFALMRAASDADDCAKRVSEECEKSHAERKLYRKEPAPEPDGKDNTAASKR